MLCTSLLCKINDGMHAAVIENGEMSSDFDVTNGTKQGCVLFTIFWP